MPPRGDRGQTQMEADLMDLEAVGPLTPSKGGSGGSATPRKGNQHGPCMVCGLLKPDMPSNSKFCWDDKRTFDAMMKQTKDQDKMNGNTEGQDRLNRMKDEAGDPPSDFSNSVVDFATRSPATGRGVKRAADDMMQLLSKYSAKTQLRQETRKVKMHKAGWMKLATEQSMYPAHIAEAGWAKAKNETPLKLQGKQGPEGELRLPMPVEEAIVAANISEHERSMVLEPKKRRVTGEQQVEEGRSSLVEGHASFNDSMFDNVGGGAFARGGGSISGSGCGSFSGFSDGTSTSSAGVVVINASADKTPRQKQEKAWGDINRLKLQDFIKEKSKEGIAKITQALLSSEKAYNDTAPRIFGDGAVENQLRYVDVMLNRMDCLRFIFVHPGSEESFGLMVLDGAGETSLQAAVKALAVVDAALEATPDPDPNTLKIVPAANVLNKIKLAQQALASTSTTRQCQLLFTKAGWDNTSAKFGDGSGFTQMEFRRFTARYQLETTLKAHDDPGVGKLGEAIDAVDEVMKTKAYTGANIENITAIMNSDGVQEIVKQSFVQFALKSMGWTSADANGAVKLGGPTSPLFESGIMQFKELLKLSFCSHLSKFRLLSLSLSLSLIAAKKDQGAAMPITNPVDLPVFYRFNEFGMMAKYVATEDQGHAVKKAVTDPTALIAKLTNVCCAGISECLNNVSGFDKKQEKEREALRTQADAEAVKKSKEEAKRASAAAKKKAQERQNIKQAEVALLNQVHEVIEDIRKYDTEADVKDALTTKSIDTNVGIPYIIMKHNCMSKIVQERSVKAAVGIFKIQYPSSVQASEDGRGQTPFANKQKAVESVSLFACSSGASYTGLEKHGLATMRYTIAGQREYAVLSWTDLLAYATKVGTEMKDSSTIEEFTEGIVNSLNSKESLDVYKEAGRKIYRGIAGPESTSFLPMGCIIVERMLGDSNVIGFRTGSLYSSTAPMESFKSYADCYKNVHGEENPVSKFWSMLQCMIVPSA
ncbi:unnamed protein product [Prorocentrum cordatum]|uniref:Uncharacterized protein n=1 Tax=Prorocentrum cordatum TaxID=2364126 RepID=A0ABN9SXW3_9DINO|nr:unnamed protein product [Polarella glacialis]